MHALYADKRNLTLLSDPAKLRSWELGENIIEVLEGAIPRTVLVTPESADALWHDRKQLFFKPAAGYGSKGAYRGDKLTKTVWSEIIKGGYVAQTFAPSGQRAVKVEGLPTTLKADIRLYTYDGDVLLTAARLYQGQTTNFRTPGGGFAPVFEIL